ncbi:Calpain-7 [Schistosoma japonicum]|nr:Calpain-7 [Schistosoma japonicum]
MADSAELEKDAELFRRLAMEQESEGHYGSAAFYYTEAAQALLNSLEAGSKTEGLLELAWKYNDKVKELKSRTTVQNTSIPNKSKVDLSRARCLLNDAISEDEKGNISEAIELYTLAIELLLSIKRDVTDSFLLEQIKTFAKMGLDRAEILKTKVHESQLSRSDSHSACSTSTPQMAGALKKSHGFLHANSSLPFKGGTGGFTPQELKVLKSTSVINGREYLPFLDALDLQERFSFSAPFVDKDGLLALSNKQTSLLSRWVRPSDYIDQPKMILAISCFSICQTVVTDCSFVASIAIAAQYERRFKRKLITNVIYPQGKNGEAVYNPCGKYMIRLNFNGVPRKVIIDDLLPMGKDGKLLCCFSNNQNELWVSLLEKAYMKVMGGYDFPGSNSNIDLHALTGWIPERISIRSSSSYFNKDREFRRLLSRFHKGHCLVTIATGQLSDDESERSGLVPTHAYAMLDIREVEGYRLFLLKNPWSHMRWKGNFSERDSQHWTAQMQTKLNFDRSSAQLIDNGVFWIDYDSLCHFFDVFYINWDPELFPFTTCVNDCWLAGSGPKKDSYASADNPQYNLEVTAKVESPIWVLLTRHIVDKADFAENKEFIAVVVYKDVKSRKVYYPYDPTPFCDSVRINSPHCLVKMLQDPGTSNYILLISQYEKSITIYYTLRVYSTASFTLSKIKDPYTLSKQITGEWKGSNAGGCLNDRKSYSTNPRFQLNLPNNDCDNQLLIELRGPRDYALGLELIRISATNNQAPNQQDRSTTGDYRRGYVVLEQVGLSGGVYNVIASTYRPGQEGPFILSVKSVHDFTITAL